MNIRIDVERDTATPMIRAAQNRLANKAQLNRAAAESMLPPVQASLRNMSETNHNAFGVRSSFWNQMLSGTYAGADDEGGFVSTPRPVALRYFGGTVYPAGATTLAIPVREEAYGKSPRDFSDLRLVKLGIGPSGGPILALVQTPLGAGLKTRGKKTKDAQGRKSIDARAEGDGVFFWLVPSATIRPDPNVLPPMEELGVAAERAVVDYIGLTNRRAS
jgi:hypothetical protein